MTPSVYHLQLHLDGQQLVSFKSTDNISKIAKAMDLNLLYREFPNILYGQQIKCGHVKRGHVIGRRSHMPSKPKEKDTILDFFNECKRPKSYEDPLNQNGVQYNSFREAAVKKRTITL
ncbi:hypothetical protein H5410_049867 [Solanum commersonii]|uniref:Uncharacterized protein n=1 Tax=Solanum commersonii TaxID=4109 RepID=A0A9J5WW86_SOLCO|nr:hypothetical protein H5410_049867 [Solanum commersonii]